MVLKTGLCLSMQLVCIGPSRDRDHMQTECKLVEVAREQREQQKEGAALSRKRKLNKVARKEEEEAAASAVVRLASVLNATHSAVVHPISSSFVQYTNLEWCLKTWKILICIDTKVLYQHMVQWYVTHTGQTCFKQLEI